MTFDVAVGEVSACVELMCLSCLRWRSAPVDMDVRMLVANPKQAEGTCSSVAMCPPPMMGKTWSVPVYEEDCCSVER